MTITPEGFPKCVPCFEKQLTCDGARPCHRCIFARRKGRCRDVDQKTLDKNQERAKKVVRIHERRKLIAAEGKKSVKKPKGTFGFAADNKQNGEKQDEAGSTRITGADSTQHDLEQNQQAEIKHYLRVINELLDAGWAYCTRHFLQPVDSVALNLPMDLSTLKENLENGEYKSVTDFDEDFMKLLNAAWQHDEGSEVHEAANMLQKVFNLVWEKTA